MGPVGISEIKLNKSQIMSTFPGTERFVQPLMDELEFEVLRGKWQEEK